MFNLLNFNMRPRPSTDVPMDEFDTVRILSSGQVWWVNQSTEPAWRCTKLQTYTKLPNYTRDYSSFRACSRRHSHYHRSKPVRTLQQRDEPGCPRRISTSTTYGNCHGRRSWPVYARSRCVRFITKWTITACHGPWCKPEPTRPSPGYRSYFATFRCIPPTSTTATG